MTFPGKLLIQILWDGCAVALLSASLLCHCFGIAPVLLCILPCVHFQSLLLLWCNNFMHSLSSLICLVNSTMSCTMCTACIMINIYLHLQGPFWWGVYTASLVEWSTWQCKSQLPQQEPATLAIKTILPQLGEVFCTPRMTKATSTLLGIEHYCLSFQMKWKLLKKNQSVGSHGQPWPVSTHLQMNAERVPINWHPAICLYCCWYDIYHHSKQGTKVTPASEHLLHTKRNHNTNT